MGSVRVDPPARPVRELLACFAALLALIGVGEWLPQLLGTGAAQDNARALVAVQDALGLPSERSLAVGAGGVTGLLYVGLHVPVTVCVLVFAFIRRPLVWVRLRAAFLWTQAATVATYVAVPTAPPRLQDVPSDAGFGLINEHAALPSGHVAFAVLASYGLVRITRSPRRRWLWAAYAPFVALLVVATQNHWWLDVASGAAVAGLGLLLAVLPDLSWARGRDDRLRPRQGHGGEAVAARGVVQARTP